MSWLQRTTRGQFRCVDEHQFDTRPFVLYLHENQQYIRYNTQQSRSLSLPPQSSLLVDLGVKWYVIVGGKTFWKVHITVYNN